MNTHQEAASTMDDRSSHKNNGTPVLDVHIPKLAWEDLGTNRDSGEGKAALENSHDDLRLSTVLR